LLDEKIQPIPKTNVDYKSMTVMPTPEEFFLLSRITGRLSVSEICQISGLSRDKTMEALLKLHAAGLLELPGYVPPKPVDLNFGAETVDGAALPPEPAPPVQLAPPTDAAPSAGRRPPAAPQQAPAAPGAADADPLYARYPVPLSRFVGDAAAMAEAVDLEQERRLEILYVYEHLERLDYFSFFGLTREADRKDIKAAYFALSKRFHPDLFYGKELGSYKARIEKIFLTINKVNQVLSHKDKRAEYEQQLAQQQGSPAAQSSSPQAASFARAEQDSGEADARKREMAFNVLVRRGEKHEASGEFEAAANEYRKAFSLKHDVLIAVRGATLLMRTGRSEEALLLAKAAVKENAGSGKPLIVLGDIHEELEQYQEALECYERALALEPDSRAKIERRIDYLKNMLA
jgi:tetratricopeptide (TPR) repeat protein